jgi:hypothetical protein
MNGYPAVETTIYMCISICDTIPRHEHQYFVPYDVSNDVEEVMHYISCNSFLWFQYLDYIMLNGWITDE